MLFAQLFGFTSVVQSGLLFRTTPLARSTSSLTPASSLESFKNIVDDLVALSGKKTWLKESVGWAFALIIDALETSKIDWRKEAIQYLTENVVASSWSPEKIALVIKLQRLHPKFDWAAALAPVFKSGDLLSTANLQTLARILKVCDYNYCVEVCELD